MLVYKFHVYAWPISLLKQVDAWLRNFILAGEISTREIYTVAWSKVCLLLEHGGLNIRDLHTINDASIMSMAWKLKAVNNRWSSFLKARFLAKDNKLKSSQLKDVALSAIVYAFWFIQHSCKQLRFQNSIVSLNNAMDLLVCTIALTGNHTKGVMKNSINKFTILKRLQITTHFAKAPSIFLVVWYPLLCHWIKCNIDSAPKGNPSFVACCGLFCNSS